MTPDKTPEEARSELNEIRQLQRKLTEESIAASTKWLESGFSGPPPARALEALNESWRLEVDVDNLRRFLPDDEIEAGAGR